MIVMIKISHARQGPASEESWAAGITDPNIVVHIPNRSLPRACVEKKEIGPRVIVEIRERPCWTDADIIDVFLAIERCCICDVGAGVVRNDCDVIADL